MSQSSSPTVTLNLPSGGRLKGHVKVPGDKSISHRSLLFGAISKGNTTIKGLLHSEDPISTIDCLSSMGVTINQDSANGIVTVQGVGFDGLQEPEGILNCGNSGTTMRLLLGLLAGRSGRHFILDGDQSLRRRPMQRVGQPLSSMGADVRGRKNDCFAPLAIKGKDLKGSVIGTPVASAQVKSAILLAALTAKGPTTVIEPAQSRDHSERMLKAFGADITVDGELGRHISIRPGATLLGQNIVIPGDISSAAFWLVAGALIPGSNLTIENVGLNPTRTGILDVMKQMEANIEFFNCRDIAGEPVGDLRITSTNLKPFSVGEDIIPRLIDEIPILTIAACFCEGESIISGASELRVKETDRLSVMVRQLRAMGAVIDEKDDGMSIRGGRPLKGAALNSEGDHRVAMSLAVASMLAIGDSSLEGSDVAAVSYPNFWKDLEILRR